METCRIWSHLLRLVESAHLLQVVPAIPSAEIFAKADARKMEVTSVRSMSVVPQGCPKTGVEFLSVSANPGVER